MGGVDKLSLIPPGVLFLRYFTLIPSSFSVYPFFSLSLFVTMAAPIMAKDWGGPDTSPLRFKFAA